MINNKSSCTRMQNNIDTNRFIFSYVCKMLFNFKELVFWHVTSLIVFSVISFILIPYIIGSFMNGQSTLRDAMWLIIMYHAFVGLSSKLYRRASSVYLTPRFQAKVASDVLKQTLSHTYNFFQDNLSGDISKKRTDIIDSLLIIYKTVINGFLFPIITIIASVVGLQVLPVKYSLYVLIWAATLLIAFYWRGKKMAELCRKASENDAKLNGLSTDIANNISSVKFFSKEEEEMLSFNKDNYQNLKVKEEAEIVYDNILTFYSISFFTMLFIGALSLFQDYPLVVDKSGVLLFVTITAGLVSRLWELAGDMEKLMLAMGRLRPAFKLLFSNFNDDIRTYNQNAVIHKGEVTFEHVDFGYGNELLFKNLNVHIKPGESVGLVGYSGAGKTSFVNLIMNLYHVKSGAIKIDGYNVANIPIKTLYNSISMIAQDCYLFNRTVAENIGYGSVNPTREEIIESAKMACAHDFIMELEHGYDTNVGEKGSKLSGGQRQRIMIARAIMKNSRIIIMDEVTSQLDSGNEAIIQRNMIKVMEDKTTIVIAHRLSTLRLMDRLLVFENGKIIESGTHMELLKNNGLYSNLWKNQMGEIECVH